jgi:hypothetical protein
MAFIYAVTVNGSEVEAQLESIELDFVANGQHTFTFQMPLANDGTRPTLGQQVILTENGTPIFKGPISGAPEHGEGGPNLDRVLLTINATSHFVYTTYRYVTATVPAGTLKAALQALLAATPTFAGITLDPTQVDGPDLPELTFTRTRFDEALQQLSDFSGGYLADVEPVNLYLRMYAPGTDAAPFDLLDSDTGEQKQVGDLLIEPTYDDTYANRVTMVISGGGPATSAETFVAADGVSAGGFTRFNTKYPASQSVNDMWPNELTFDGVQQGPIAFGVDALVSNGGSFAWAWDYASSPAALVFDEASTGSLPTGAQTIDIEYAIGYPFTLTRNNTGAQVAPIYIRERLIEVQDAMTLDTATAYADAILAKRSVSFKKASFASWQTGWRIGQTLTITIASRDTDSTFLITDVKMRRQDNAGPEQDCFMRYEITALEGTTSQANWRDVPKSWLGGGSSGSGGVSATGSVSPSSGLLTFVRLTLGDTAFKAIGDGSAVILPALASPRRAKPVCGTLRVNTSSGYTNINAGAVLTVQSAGVVLATILLNEAGSPGVSDLSDVLGASLDKAFDFPVPAMRVSGSRVIGLDPSEMGNTSSLVAASIVVALDNGGDGALTGGDADNQVTLDLWYVEESLTVSAEPDAILAFSGFGDSPMKFTTSSGIDAGTPASNPQLGTGGCAGIVALDDGTVCVNGASYPGPNFECTLALDSTFATILGFETPQANSIACNYTDAFYGYHSGGIIADRIHKFDNTGTKVGDWITGLTSGNPYALGVAPDESFAYFALWNADTVTKYDLGGLTGSTFVTETGYKIRPNSILVLRNGEVVIAWDAVTGNGFFRHYDASGATLHTYSPSGTNVAPHTVTPGLDDTSFWGAYYDSDLSTYSGVTICEIEVSTGTVLHTFDPDDGTFEFDGPFCLLRAAFA